MKKLKITPEVRRLFKTLDTKYILLARHNLLVVRCRSQGKSFCGSIRIQPPFNTPTLRAAYKKALELREALYLELTGSKYRNMTAAIKNTSRTKLRAIGATNNSCGYTNVHPYILNYNHIHAYKAKGSPNDTSQIKSCITKTFSFPAKRTEEEAYLLACKQVDVWNGRELQTDEFYLSYRRLVDWNSLAKPKNKAEKREDKENP